MFAEILQHEEDAVAELARSSCETHGELSCGTLVKLDAILPR